MPHHVYTTEGFVLHLSPSRESDSLAVIFTRELGLLRALARGIREERSRLRMSLMPLALVKASFVRGRGSWRITTVTLLKDNHSLLKGRGVAEESLLRVTGLLSSLLQGEEKNVRLFDEFKNSVEKILEIETNEVPDWELWTVSRLLIPLGYLGENEAPQDVTEAKKDRKKYLNLVNDRLRQSGLYKV